MKTISNLTVSQFEALLLVCVITFVVTEAVCLLLGQLCQLIDGADE
jgi:hypothetical protein